MQLLWVTDPQRVNESQNIPLGDAEAADEFIWSDRNVLPSRAHAWVMQATMTCDGDINLMVQESCLMISMTIKQQQADKEL